MGKAKNKKKQSSKSTPKYCSHPSTTKENQSQAAEVKNHSEKEKTTSKKSKCSWLRSCFKGNSDNDSQNGHSETQSQSEHAEKEESPVNQDSCTVKSSENKEFSQNDANRRIVHSIEVHHSESSHSKQSETKGHEQQQQQQQQQRQQNHHSLHDKKKSSQLRQSDPKTNEEQQQRGPSYVEQYHSSKEEKPVTVGAPSYQSCKDHKRFSIENGHKNAFVNNEGGYRHRTVAVETVNFGMNGNNSKFNDDLGLCEMVAPSAPSSISHPSYTNKTVSKSSSARSRNSSSGGEGRGGEGGENTRLQSQKQSLSDLNPEFDRSSKLKCDDVDNGLANYVDHTRPSSNVSIIEQTCTIEKSHHYPERESQNASLKVVENKCPTVEVTAGAKLSFAGVHDCYPKSAHLKETRHYEPRSVDVIAPDNELYGKNNHCNDGDEITADLKCPPNINYDKTGEEWRTVIDDNSDEWKVAEEENIDYSKVIDSQNNAEVDPNTVYEEQIPSITNFIPEANSNEDSNVALEEDNTDRDLTLANGKHDKSHKGKNKRNSKRKQKAPKNGDVNADANSRSGGNGDNAELQSVNREVIYDRHSELRQKENVISRVVEQRSPRGLQNLGNTCFFNAVMQNLNQSFLLEKCMSNYLLQGAGHNCKLTKAMINFYKEMIKSSTCYNPSEVFRNICTRSPRFSGGRQQDSHELLRHLLDGLRAEEREVSEQSEKRKILTNVDKVFGGHFLTVYTCEKCKTPYHVCEPMLDISLPIAFDDNIFDSEEEDNSTSDQLSSNMETDLDYCQAVKYLMSPLNENQMRQVKEDDTCKSNSSNNPINKQKKGKGKRKSNVSQQSSKRSQKERSVLDCLKAFTRVESIEEEYLCMTCNANQASEGATEPMMTSAKKRTLIYNPPALLTLHLKRFEQTYRGFVKCNDVISFETELDLSPYCCRCCKRIDQNERNIWYSLYGVVVHGGSLDGGHYVAYVKQRSPDENTKQFLQTKFLDRNLLTTDELVKQVKDWKQTGTISHTQWKPKSQNGTWYYISDSHYSMVQEKDVMQQQVYLLFYERMTRENMEIAKDKSENTETCDTKF